ncbi:MAG: hypothetical protein U0L54_06995 [Bacteroidales bacterium]|nr:hypothetical protein [Bacteroidales bacterium]
MLSIGFQPFAVSIGVPATKQFQPLGGKNSSQNLSSNGRVMPSSMACSSLTLSSLAVRYCR